MKHYWLGALLLAAVTAQAAEQSTPQSAAKPKPRVICQNEATTGSHIKKRNCMTEAQYEERKRRDQEAAQRVNNAPVRPTTDSSALR